MNNAKKLEEAIDDFVDVYKKLTIVLEGTSVFATAQVLVAMLDIFLDEFEDSWKDNVTFNNLHKIVNFLHLDTLDTLDKFRGEKLDIMFKQLTTELYPENNNVKYIKLKFDELLLQRSSAGE